MSNVAVTLNMSRFAATQTSRRSPKYVGPLNQATTSIQYVFVGNGNPSGTIALSSCTAGANTGTGSIYTCSFAAPQAVGYTDLDLSIITPVNSVPTTIGTGNYGGAPFDITGGAATMGLTVTMTPIISGPAISIVPGQATEFFQDGTSQSIEIETNEIDAIGDIITTFYGPVSDWPGAGLTVALTGGTAGLSFNGYLPGLSETVSQVPNAQNGATFTIVYTGTGSNGSSLAVGLTDGVNTPANLTIPYVTMTASTNAVNVSGGPGNFFIFETTTGGSLPDTALQSSSNCGANVSFTPGSGADTFQAGSTTSKYIDYSATHVGGASGSCVATVASSMDGNLYQQVTITY